MKAFVTGSTGLLGSNLVHQLVKSGYEVRALARSREKAAKLLDGSGAEIVIGDMENVAGFAAELKNVDVLFHTAAYFREYYGPGDHWGTLERINVTATIQLLEAAQRQGVKKVIYVSSSGVIGRTKDGRPGDESTPPDNMTLQNLYFKSKVAAEAAIAEFSKSHHLPIIQILPTAMFGPRDSAPTTMGRIVLDFLEGKLPAIPPGGFSVVDARDVAQGMIQAVEKGKNGEHYLLSHSPLTMADIVEVLSKVTGIPGPTLRIPYPAALAFAWFSETRARLTGVPSAVTINGVRTLHAGNSVHADKAKRELGATFRPFEDTLRDEVEWYIQNGYVSKQAAGVAGLAHV